MQVEPTPLLAAQNYRVSVLRIILKVQTYKAIFAILSLVTAHRQKDYGKLVSKIGFAQYDAVCHREK